MQWLESVISGHGGQVAVGSLVTSIRRLYDQDGGGFEVSVGDKPGHVSSSITCDTLVNSAGLAAVYVQNLIMPEERKRKSYFAKGTYFSGGGIGVGKVRRLVYPAPVKGLGGLGTHLTLDLAGRVRFGPDVEWVCVIVWRGRKRTDDERIRRMTQWT